MAYTVKQLTVLAGVSVRTLHWYDVVGLLSPAYCGENGYRYYEDKEHLRLKKILFLKGLGFSLEAIAELLEEETDGIMRALNARREAL